MNLKYNQNYDYNLNYIKDNEDNGLSSFFDRSFENDYLENSFSDKKIDENFNYFLKSHIFLSESNNKMQMISTENEFHTKHNSIFINITSQKNTEKGKLGRKKKDSGEIGIHNIFSQDNLFRKSKKFFHDALLELINSKINDYNSKKTKLFITINNKEYKVEKLLNLSEKITKDLSVETNKALFKKQIKNIFLEISKKYQNYPKNYNMAVIDELCTNIEFKEIADILNLDYLDGLRYYRRDEDALNDDKLECLKGLELIFDKIPKKLEKNYNKNYEESLIYTIKNLEIINDNKKPRKKRKSQ